MEEEVRQEKEKEEFERRREELRRQDEAKTNKNKAKRDKKKARKMKVKGVGDADQQGEEPRKGFDNGVDGVPDARMTDANEASHGIIESGDQMDVKHIEEIGIIIHEDD
jgi:Protein of unknown function (DUF1168)